MRPRSVGLGFSAWVLVAVLPVGRAHAAESADVSAVEQKATTAFALGRFTEAATNFEKAFELKPDSALLYNAAQAHRLAGNKERALSLYENYLRVYGKRERREEIETRIAELKQAIEHDKAVSNSPPTGTEPMGAAGSAAAAAGGPRSVAPAALPAAPMPESSSSTSVLVGPRASTEEDNGSVVRRPWFWVVAGGGVVAAVVVGVLVGTGGSKDPSASMGKVNGN